MKPFIKYPGGKRWLAEILANRLFRESVSGCYVEPFLGGGSMFLAVQPANLAWINDVNPHVIRLFKGVRDSLEALVGETKILARAYNSRDAEGQAELFYDVRKLYNTDTLTLASGVRVATSTVQASRFLFLLRSCFNGLIRFNKSGGFNSPHGKYPKIYIDEDAIEYAAAALGDVAITCGDFDLPMRQAGEGDVVYLDPPYHGVFSNYSAGGFSESDQERLYAAAFAAASMGARVYASLPDTPYMRGMWVRDGFFRAYSIPVRRAISAKVSGRGNAMELLVYSGSDGLPELGMYDEVSE